MQTVMHVRDHDNEDPACKATASLPAVKPGTHSVAMAKLQGGNAPDMSLIINDDDDYDSDDRRFSA